LAAKLQDRNDQAACGRILPNTKTHNTSTDYSQTNTFIEPFYQAIGARGSVVVKALCYKPEGRGFDSDEVNFEICLILAALGPGVYSASNRNEYQKQTNNNVSWE
jgi:hypothetical protein